MPAYLIVNYKVENPELYGEYSAAAGPAMKIGEACKLIAFDTTVNVSLGLPIQRTSVDHGTAFDIAWTGQADHTNMLAAIAYAERIAAAPAYP